jgi:hypothetical protein
MIYSLKALKIYNYIVAMAEQEQSIEVEEKSVDELERLTKFIVDVKILSETDMNFESKNTPDAEKIIVLFCKKANDAGVMLVDTKMFSQLYPNISIIKGECYFSGKYNHLKFDVESKLAKLVIEENMLSSLKNKKYYGDLIDKLTPDQQKKYCLIFLGTVFHEYDTLEEAEKTMKTSNLNFHLYCPQ